MVALPTPAAAATPSTVILPKPSDAISSRVASRIARSARGLRGRPGDRRGSGDGSALSVTGRGLRGKHITIRNDGVLDRGSARFRSRRNGAAPSQGPASSSPYMATAPSTALGSVGYVRRLVNRPLTATTQRLSGSARRLKNSPARIRAAATTRAKPVQTGAPVTGSRPVFEAPGLGALAPPGL